MHSTQINPSRGFTLVEVLIVAPIIILFIGAFVGLVVNLTGNTLRLRESNNAAYNVQDAIDSMQSDADKALGFLSTTGSLAVPQGKNGTAVEIKNSETGQPDALIIKLPATTKNPIDPTASAVYTGTGACNSQNPAYTYTAVYLVINKTLYKRTILQQSAPCQTPWQRNSCNESNMAAYASICQISDEKLLENVETLDIQYYLSDTSTTALNDNASESAGAISINITVSKPVSGETVSYSGTARVSSSNLKLGSTQGDPSKGTITPTANSANPYVTDFTWSKAVNAVSYTVRYRPNAATSWTTANINVTDQSQQQYSYPVTSSARKQAAEIEVSVNTASGTYTYGTASRVIPRWNECPNISSGWDYYGTLTGDNSFNTLGYTRTVSGAVGLKGLIRGGSFGTVVCNLPVGFRPAQRIIFNAPCASSSPASCRVDINSNGDVYMTTGTGSGSNGWVSLDGIIFMTPEGTPSWQAPAFISPWQNYGNVYPNLGAWRDGLNRVWVQGLVNGGGASQGIATVPANMYPNGGSHYPISSGDRASAINVNTNGRIDSRATYYAWASTQLLYYPAGVTTNTFTSLSWPEYGGGWSPARCLKGADDIVILQGLIRNGNTAVNAQIANVSSCGSTPTMSTGKRALFSAWTPEQQGRIDMDTTGWLLSVSTNATWTSLDGIHYISD